ncbi:hypothetical protein Ahy_B10g102840 [Arachis hypogaea]|uniref:Uncharacterized protein n=1 Tax=Arachis hypogaea TaxID=3818 RepID=A0A444X2X5_ARAHY|nr:hypothetical protein Ahy_B10g102840 [Arachis hypogaea]
MSSSSTFLPCPVVRRMNAPSPCFLNPYNLFREAYSALRVHLNTSKLLEEKNLPNIIDKFVFHGLKDFAEIGGVSPRFVIIDDGWQSINYDNSDDPYEDAKNLILGGPQMTARLHREVDKRIIELPEIRETGEYIAELKLHPEVTARVKLNVFAN